MKKIYLILAVVVLLLTTACGTDTVTPTTATLSSTTADTFIVATEAETETETQKPTEDKDDVKVSDNVTVERNEDNANRAESTANTNGNNSTSQQNNSPAPRPTSAPSKATQSNKTWHNAVYKYVEHPAETKEVWVVDKESYTYENPIYGDVEYLVCDTCNQDIELLSSHSHDEPFTYHSEIRNEIIDTETVVHPEQGHYETVVIKEAWTEKILIKEAGYY